MPFEGPWHFWWVFPIIGLGFMLLVVMFVIRPVALAIAKSMRGTGSDVEAAKEHRSPAEILRDRYALGEINQEQYREALLDVLKDMYVRGEITVDEFEARAEELSSTESSHLHEEWIRADSSGSQQVGHAE